MSASCVACGGEAGQRCSKCSAVYCSQECQLVDWEGGHSTACGTRIGAAPSVVPAPGLDDVPGKLGPDTQPFVTPHQAPKKGEGEEPMVVPLPRVSVKDLVPAIGSDIAWLIGKRPYYMLDFQHAPAPVRALYDDTADLGVLHAELARFDHNKMHRKAPPHIPPLRVNDVVYPVMRTVSGAERTIMMHSLKQMNALRNAFNSVGDALWDLFEMNNATDAHFARAYGILLAGQDAITRVDRPLHAFTSDGVALYNSQMDNAQLLFELVDEIATAYNGAEVFYPVQNTGCLVARMFMDSLSENEAYVTATLEHLVAHGTPDAARFLDDADPADAGRAAAEALASGRDIIKMYSGKMSAESVAFCDSLLDTIEVYGGGGGASGATDAGFIGAGFQRRFRAGVYAVGVLYAVSTIADVCFNGGTQTGSVLGAMLPSIAVVAASGVSLARGQSPAVFVDTALSSYDSGPDTPADDESTPKLVLPDITLDGTQRALEGMYGIADDLNSANVDVELGMKGGALVADEVFLEAEKRHTAAEGAYSDAETSLAALQGVTVDNHEILTDNVKTLVERRDIEKRVAVLQKESSDALWAAYLAASDALERDEYTAILEKVVDMLAITAASDNTAWSPGTVISKPTNEVLEDNVLRVVEGIYGAGHAKSEKSRDFARTTAEVLDTHWPAVKTLAFQHHEARSKQSPETRTALDSATSLKKHLRTANAGAMKLATGTIEHVRRSRANVATYGRVYTDYEKKVKVHEKARQEVEVARITRDVLVDLPANATDHAKLAVAKKQVAITRAIGQRRIDEQTGWLRKGYGAFAETSTDSMYADNIAATLLAPLTNAVSNVMLNISLVGETVYGKSRVSDWYATQRAAMVATFASTKTVLGAAYHLAKITGAGYNMVKMSRAEEHVDSVTGASSDDNARTSGLYAWMTTTLTTYGSSSTPRVAQMNGILCRSLFAANLGGLAVVLAREVFPVAWPGESANPLEWLVFFGRAIGPIVGVGVALLMRDCVGGIGRAVVRNVITADLFLQRLAIRGYLIMMGTGWRGPTVRTLANLMLTELGKDHTDDERYTTDEWEMLKVRVIELGDTRSVRAMVELDVWYSSIAAFLNAASALFLLPLLTSLVATKLQGMVHNTEDNRVMLDNVLIKDRKSVAASPTNVDNMLFLRQMLTPDAKERAADGVKLIQETLRKGIVQPKLHPLVSAPIIADNAALMAPLVAAMENMAASVYGETIPPVELIDLATETMVRMVGPSVPKISP